MWHVCCGGWQGLHPLFLDFMRHMCIPSFASVHRVCILDEKKGVLSGDMLYQMRLARTPSTTSNAIARVVMSLEVPPCASTVSWLQRLRRDSRPLGLC